MPKPKSSEIKFPVKRGPRAPLKHWYKKGDPRPANAGRKKGTKNKITTTIRSALQMSFDDLGAQEYLKKLAIAEPRAYATLLAKAMPTEITGANGAPLVVRVLGGLPDTELDVEG